MKIAFVIHPQQEIRLPFDADGSTPNLTYQNARRLVQEKDEVIIYARQAEGQPATEYDEAGIQYRRLPSRGEDLLLKPFNLLERIVPLGNAKRPLFSSSHYFRGFARQVARDLKAQRCDVVHIHNFSQFAPIIRSVNPNIKIVLHMHCEWLGLLDRELIARRLRHVDLVLGCSDYITEQARRRFPRYAGRCQTVYNGVDIAHFDVAEHPAPAASMEGEGEPVKRLLYVGRVSPEKGVHVLLDAFKRVAAARPDVHLDIVGAARLLAYPYLVGLSREDPVVARLDRFYGRSLKEKLERLLLTRDTSYLDDLRSRLSDEEAARVTFHGPVPHSVLKSFYQRADLAILPSVCNEAFGMSLIESMASGVPAVAARAGGIPEVVDHGTTGLIVERDDPEAMAEAILHLLNHDDLRRNMGIAGRIRTQEHFSWERVNDSLLQHYKPFRQGEATPASVSA